DEAKHFCLAVGELRRSVVWFDAPGQQVELAEELRRHGRRDQRLSSCNGAHRACQLVDGGFLQEVTGRADAYGGEEILFVLRTGEHHDPRRRLRVTDAARRL